MKQVYLILTLLLGTLTLQASNMGDLFDKVEAMKEVERSVMLTGKTNYLMQVKGEDLDKFMLIKMMASELD